MYICRMGIHNIVILVVVATVVSYVSAHEDDRVREYVEGMNGYNKRAENLRYQYTIKSWAYNTNITEYNQKQMTEMSLQWSDFAKKEASEAAKFNLSAMTDARLIRQINMILDVGISGYHNSDVLRKIAELEAEMTGIYSSAKWCKTPTECLQLEPGLTAIFTNSRNYDELRDAWKGWRDVSGKMMRSKFQEFVTLMNMAIKAGGKYPDMGAYYRSWYDDAEFENDARKIFDQLAPLYDELHAYVRRKLKMHYDPKHFPSSGHIPAHLLGNMWAQQWNNIYALLEPYPGKGNQNITKAMTEQKYNVTHMYRLAEEFFVSIGLQPMPDSFWTNSMLVKPPDRDVVCHASAWDFHNGTDFRIKQCTIVTGEQLNTVHHEMGHVQYYLEYKHQPYLFRSGANPGFHEGVADIASLSFQTPEHLKEIGLIQELPNGTEGDINFLMKMALEKVAFLPFGYLIDQWRWSVYRGETTPSNYNKAWWDLRCKYQGISPPVARSEQDFDPGAKYHIPDNTPYIRYFVSFVLQFQWHQALCQVMNNTRPLHRCDIYKNKIAGDRLKAMLQMGSSEHWSEALFKLTRGTTGETRKLSAAPLLAYFEPLRIWLKEENQKANETATWDKSNCPSSSFVTVLSGAPTLTASGCLPMIIVACISVSFALVGDIGHMKYPFFERLRRGSVTKTRNRFAPYLNMSLFQILYNKSILCRRDYVQCDCFCYTYFRMGTHSVGLLLVLVTLVSFVSATEDERVQDYLQGINGYNTRAANLSNHYSLKSWAYNTNITEYNQKQMTEMSLQWSDFAKKEALEAAKFNLSAMTNASLIRQINMILDVGISGYQDSDVLRKIAELEAEMTGIYSSAKWCKTSTECLALEPGLTAIITNSRNYDELRDAWKGWRDVSGKMMRSKYQEFVTLMNMAIKAGGKYTDMGAYYRSWYEDPKFENDVREIFNELAPLYDQLHAYVRRKLKMHYDAKYFPSSGHIPAHLFGNMWAQQWNNIYDMLEPYPGQGSQNLTKAMIEQNYNVTHMYRVAEEFFVSIGLKPMPDSFWTNSMLVKPPDRDVVCHASAWDFSNGTDFRIKQCTIVTGDQLNTVHHEMGHVQYYLEYNHQPYLFRSGANPGFHEGVADIASLSFQTPEHLKEIGLIPELPNGTEGDINFLMQMALEKVAFLPFGYLIDQWRWSVYRGETTPSNYNKAWWNLRCKYQGVSPPVARSEQDFDPGAKFHIPGNTPYIRYFVSFVLQFQWHQALCQVMNSTRPLHRCDIYKNTIAGDRLKEMLQMGSSEQWGEALFKLTRGTNAENRKLSAAPLLAYFKPLQDWLTEENQKAKENATWDKENCPSGSFVTVLNGAPTIAATGSLPMLILAFIAVSCLQFADNESK
ncbi:angiotensin-converting enzyme-like [Dreissena polymorpha]|uniref:angiotensin-converting enzyme-like n=1 Tax=Dreissena polymorpha TaxID=45954 RepID=UPI0022653729|nr:angiotensin-converting enzyme-like [Dreissena polymorpha]